MSAHDDDQWRRRRKRQPGALGPAFTPGSDTVRDADFQVEDPLLERLDDLPPAFIDPARLSDEMIDDWGGITVAAPDETTGGQPQGPASGAEQFESAPVTHPSDVLAAPDDAWDVEGATDLTSPVAVPASPGDDWEQVPSDDDWAAPALPASPGTTSLRDRLAQLGSRPDEADAPAIPSWDEDEPRSEPVAAGEDDMAAASAPTHEVPVAATPPARPQMTGVALRGALAAHSAVSIVSSRMKSEVDELNDAFSAFGQLEPGQKGFIRLSFRPDDTFRGKAEQWMQAVRGGEDPRQLSKGQSAMAWIGWLFQALSFHSMAPEKRGSMEAPRSPRKQGPPPPLPSAQLSEETKEALREAEIKSREVAHFETRLWCGAFGKKEDEAALQAIAHQAGVGFQAFTTVHQRVEFEDANPIDPLVGFLPPRPEDRMILSAGELGELGRVPDDLTRPQRVRVARATMKPLPLANPIDVPDRLNPPPGIVPLGLQAKGTEDESVIGINNKQLDQHMFITGRTGTGKSVLMQWVVFGAAKANYPIVLVDPHGALVDDVAANLIRFCPERADDLVIIDFSDKDWPVALNPLDISSRNGIEPAVGAVREMFAHFAFDGAGAPRAMTYLEQALTVLAEANTHLKNPDVKCSLLQVGTFFTDPEFRRLAVELCSNPSILEAYRPETGPFETMSERQQVEHTGAIRRVIDRLGSSDSFGNVFGSPSNRMDFPRLILENKIVLLKMARFHDQKELGEFIGRLVIPWMLASMSTWGRHRDPFKGTEEGRGCRLFVDEAPTMFGPGSSAIAVLAEARKFDFGLISAAQFPGQFPKDVEQALYANTASKICLALDKQGIGGIAQSITGDTPLIKPEDIVGLPNYTAYANILLQQAGGGGTYTSGPFSMHTLPPLAEDGRGLTPQEEALLDRVKERSRAMVCNSREQTEDARRRLLDDLKAALNQAAQQQARTAGAQMPEQTTHLDIDADAGWGWDDAAG